MSFLKSPHGRSSIQSLARQMYPEETNFFKEAYEDVTKELYSYLFIVPTLFIQSSKKVISNLKKVVLVCEVNAHFILLFLK